MARWWWPLAAAAAVGSGIFLWWTQDDFERSRYFALEIGIPHSFMVALGLLGYSGELKQGRKRK